MRAVAISCAAWMASCTHPTSTSSSPSRPSTGPEEVAQLARLRLAYFPDEPEREGESGVGRPAGGTRIAGPGCLTPSDEERCGAFWLGEPSEVVSLEMKCLDEQTSSSSATVVWIDGLRRAMAAQGSISRETLTAVALLDVDDDGQPERVLAASFEVAATQENEGAYGQGPRCTALAIEWAGGLVPLTEQPCGLGTSERLLRALRLPGVEGVVLHVARQGSESQGAFLTHISRGKSVPVPLPPCDGNG
jgi:hypothetical protein